MKKRGRQLAVISLMVLASLLFSVAVQAYTAYNTNVQLPKYPAYPSEIQGASKEAVYDSLEAQREGSQRNTARYPDLAVSHIDVPDTLPFGAVIEEFDVTVKNTGSARADGTIKIDIEFEGGLLPKCKQVVYLGGYIGSSRRYSSEGDVGNLRRYTYINPGESATVPVYTPFECKKPITKDLKISVSVDPKGARNSLNPRGRIFESDETNNELAKTVHFSTTSDVPLKVELRFAKGVTAFSIPVDTQISQQALSQATSCTSFKTVPPEAQQARDGRRSIDFSELKSVGSDEILKPGVPYFVTCPFESVITVEGKDLPPFDATLINRGITVVPTRIGMQNGRIIDYIRNCGGRFYASNAYTYVPGARNYANKAITENVPLYTAIVPGLVYLINCDESNKKITWDPKEADYHPETNLPTYKPLYHSIKAFEYTQYPTVQQAVGSGYRNPSRARYQGVSYVYKSSTKTLKAGIGQYSSYPQ